MSLLLPPLDHRERIGALASEALLVWRPLVSFVLLSETLGLCFMNIIRFQEAEPPYTYVAYLLCNLFIAE